MNKLNAPVFRKSMSGYKKQDVNNYILSLNKKYSESEKDYKHNISKLNSDLSKANDEIEALKVQFEEEKKVYESLIAEKEAEIAVKNDEYAKLSADMEAKITESESLKAEVEVLRNAAETKRSTIADSFGGITDEGEKAVLFDCISAKTGEIMLIACKTADDIIAKAKAEAAAIIEEANMKKDAMLNNISGSADTVASDISSYIKTAVDGCIDRIYTSIKTVNTDKK